MGPGQALCAFRDDNRDGVRRLFNGARTLMVPWGIIGALVGLAFALVEYVFFGALMQRVEMTGGSADSRRILDWVRKGQLVVFPAVGFFAGRWAGNLFGVQ